MGVEVPSNPINRKEQYLAKIAGQTVEIPAEPLTREEAYLDYIAKHGGGGGGTNDYDDLLNQPKINNVTLKGNKSAENLGLASKTTVDGILNGTDIDSFEDVENALTDKADVSDVKKEFGGTLDQWNALTTAEKKEYDTYDITDDYSDGNYIYLPTIYSEEEREVGVWKDGKPLYQKTVVVNSPAYDTDWHNVSHGISNIDSIIRVNGAIKNAESGSAEEFYDLSVYRPNSQTGIVVGATKTNVTYINNWLESATELWVTLQYTKTTDTAGSGTWTPTGELAHHYSTDEQIIGTWIDGKTLYRRVINAGTLPNNTSKKIELGLNFDNVINIRGFVKAGNDGFLPLPFVSFDGSTSYSTWVTTDSNGDLLLITNAAFGTANYEAYVILEYTKTTA